MSATPNRRHRLLIDMPVQMGVALRLVVLWIATALVTSLMTVLMQFYADPTTSFFSHLGAVKNWSPILLACAVTMPIAVLDLFRFTHRFVGPVYRLRSELRSLAAGEARPPLKFRKGDYWQDMADDFNAVAELISSNAQCSAPLSQADAPAPSCHQEAVSAE